jgi:uncharacterized protein (TIGR02678 family)
MAAQDARSIERHQQRQQREEFRQALRALLMTPLMDVSHEALPMVRRHADALREWFARETGWVLHAERDGARLYKRPADISDPTRGLRDYDRRRYVLLCLACAVLERSDTQVTLQLLGDRLLSLAGDPLLQSRGFSFGLGTHHERRELVVVCRTLLEFGVLSRVVGDEDAFVQAAGSDADALYDVHRRALAGVLAAVRGPSTWPPGEEPTGFDERLHSLVDEYVADSDEARRAALRHHLTRRLLDDPVVYLDDVPAESRSYFLNQRGILAQRVMEATGLLPEQRAEGLAMVDEDGELTDVAMPAEGTDAHATLLIAEYLCGRMRNRDAEVDKAPSATTQELAAFIAGSRERFGRYWRRSAREPGAEHELTDTAIRKLRMLQLVRVAGERVHPLPALARFALGETDVRPVGQARLVE